MKMKLNVKDRINIGAMMPKKAGLQDLLIVKGINEKINFNQDEVKLLQFKSINKNGTLTWNKNIEEKEIGLSDIELNFLKDRISELDRNKEITLDMVDTISKIKDL